MHDTIYGAALSWLRSPFSNFRQLRNLSKFDKKDGRDVLWALQDISFSVRHDEIVGIIGGNGAGKSTLLKVISRITQPTSGEVRFRGRVSSLLEVGTGFHPELTGRENIYLNGTILGMSKKEIDSKFDQIVEFSGVEKFIDTPVKRYSSGMKVRLAFSVAAHLEPEILLIDEVLAVGDVAFQKKCLGKMGEVAREGRTVLFVSHNMDAVRKLCTRAILLCEGRLLLESDSNTVVERYLSSSSEGEEERSSIKLPSGAPEAVIFGRYIRFMDINGEERNWFRIMECWKIVLEFQVAEASPHVIGAVGLSTLTGVPILTYWSKPKDLKSGGYAIEFRVDLPLRKCELEFSVGLSTYERTVYYVDRIGHVTISEIAQGNQPFRVSGKGGLLLAQQEVDIVSLSDDISSNRHS